MNECFKKCGVATLVWRCEYCPKMQNASMLRRFVNRVAAIWLGVNYFLFIFSLSTSVVMALLGFVQQPYIFHKYFWYAMSAQHLLAVAVILIEEFRHKPC